MNFKQKNIFTCVTQTTMKIFSVNNFNFKGIYKYTLDQKNDPEGAWALNALAEQNKDDDNLEIVSQHQGSGVVAAMLNEYLSLENSVKLDWLKQHAKLNNYKLPDFVSENIWDMYIITEEDAEEYRKMAEKRTKTSYLKFCLIKNFVQNLKYRDNKYHSADIVLNTAIDYNKGEQKVFDKFLKSKKIDPIIITVENEEK